MYSCQFAHLVCSNFTREKTGTYVLTIGNKIGNMTTFPSPFQYNKKMIFKDMRCQGELADFAFATKILKMIFQKPTFVEFV